MALKSVDLTGTDTFEIDSDPDKGTPAATKFHFRRMTPRLEAWVKDQATSFTEGSDGETVGHFEPNKACIATVMVGLTGWTNFQNSAGTPVPFSTKKANVAGVDLEMPDKKTFDHLTLEWIRELSGKMNGVNEVAPEEVKDSASSPSPES